MSTVETPELKFVESDGLALAVWDWPGEEAPLLFAHATSFHGRVWDEVVRQFPGRRRLAMEFRGHGRSGTPAPPCAWSGFARDVTAVARRFGLNGAIGIGHSMGGYSLAASDAARSGAFSQLLLVDPVILPPEYYRGLRPEVDYVRRRRVEWSGPDEMFESFRSRLPFERWNVQVLHDYCDYALLPNGGSFSLACPPEVEASIYENSNAPETNIHGRLAEVKIPVTVLRAETQPQSGEFDLAASRTWPRLASGFPNGRDVPLPGKNHYIPMEAPEVVVEAVRGMIQE